MIKFDKVSKKFKLEGFRRKTLLKEIGRFLKGKKKGYLWALKDISFEIEKSESVAIIGPNGCGKTTLLKIIAGILEPSSGEVDVEREVTPILQLGLGFRGNLSVGDNIYLYSSILGRSKYETNKVFWDIVRFAGLEKFVEMKAKDLSSGMVSRLAFSIAIHADPEVLLVDEVFAVGDKEFREKSLKVLEDFKKKGKTILFVSHDLELVRKYFDRTIYIDKGEIVFDGKASEAVDMYERKK